MYEGSFPFENFEELKESGILKNNSYQRIWGRWSKPIRNGPHAGATGQRRWFNSLSSRLACWFNAKLLRINRPWPEPVYTAFCKEVVDNGEMLNSFASEPASGSPSRGGKPKTIAKKTQGWLAYYWQKNI